MIDRSLIAALSVVLWVSTSASAAVTMQWVEVNNQGAVPGFRTMDLVIDMDGLWCCTAMLIELTQGSFYQDPNGLVTTPFPLLIDMFPTVEFDTYVAENDHTDVFVVGGAGDVGGAPELIFNDTVLNISWASPPPLRSEGVIKIARVTLSRNARGTWAFATIGQNTDFTTFTGEFQGSVQTQLLPEPGSVAMLGLLATLGLRRRARLR